MFDSVPWRSSKTTFTDKDFEDCRFKVTVNGNKKKDVKNISPQKAAKQALKEEAKDNNIKILYEKPEHTKETGYQIRVEGKTGQFEGQEFEYFGWVWWTYKPVNAPDWMPDRSMISHTMRKREL